MVFTLLGVKMRSYSSHRCLLIILLLLIVCPKAYGNSDDYICNMYNESMFCNCESISETEYGILCFVFREMTDTNKIWSAFKNVQFKIVSLTFTPRPPAELDFMPSSVLRHLPFLQRFSIQQARLGSLPAYSVSNMTHLSRLLLERNEITNLEPYSISHLPKLEKLILSENNLHEILADTLVDLMNLEELFLDRNNISRIETCAFCSMHNLRELVLWDNKLTDLTELMFRGLRYLTRIDLYKNHIRVINANVFRPMPKLHELDLKENRIEHLSPRAFNGLVNLLKLHLSGNRLKTLSETVFLFPKKLLHVDVSSNELRTISFGVVTDLVNIENKHFNLKFKDNPLECGCDLRWIPAFIESCESTTFVRELRHAKCRTEYGDFEKVTKFHFGPECDTKTISTPPTTVRKKSTILSNDTQIPSHITYGDYYPYGKNVTFSETSGINEDFDKQLSASDDNNSSNNRHSIKFPFCVFSTIIIIGLMWNHRHAMQIET